MSRSFGMYIGLTMTMGVGAFLLYGLSAISPLVMVDLDISRIQFGLFATVAFITAGLFSSLAGQFVDSHRERTVIIVLYTGITLAFVVAFLAANYSMLLFAVLLTGISQTVSNPITNKIVAYRLPVRYRGVATGIKQSGVQVMQLCAGLVIPPIAIIAGWRFAIASALVLVWSGGFISLRYLATPVTSIVQTEDTLVKNKADSRVWFLASYALLTGATLQATNIYLPLYAHETLALPVQQAGLIAAAVGGMGVVARIVWGTVASSSTHCMTPLLLVGLTAVISIGCILSASALRQLWLLWAGVFAFGLTGVAANSVTMVILMRLVSIEDLGRSSGIVAMGMFLGFAVGPVMFGGIVDYSQSYIAGWLSICLLYCGATILVLIVRNMLETRAGL